MDTTREPTSELRRRQLFGWGSLLVGVLFAAIAVAAAVSCQEGGLLTDFQYFAAIAVFVLGSFGLYQVNIFGIRSPIGRVVSAAAVVAAVEAVLAFATFYISFSRCWTF